MRTPSILAFVSVVAAPLAAQSPRPSHRIAQGVAYDVARERVVLFGGVSFGEERALNDTWEWDGDRWTRRDPAVSPPGRGAPAMVYDPVRRRVVMYGGFNEQSGNEVLGDTWEWDGENWIDRTTENGPGHRGFHSMYFDPTRGRVMLMGGITGESPLDDVWEWDGTTWTQVVEATPFRGMTPMENTRQRAYRAAMRSDLRNLVTAMESYFADNFDYARSMEQLGRSFTSSSGITITIVSSSGRGWSAIAVHEAVPTAKCGIYIGDAEPPFDGLTSEGSPECVGFE